MYSTVARSQFTTKAVAQDAVAYRVCHAGRHRRLTGNIHLHAQLHLLRTAAIFCLSLFGFLSWGEPVSEIALAQKAGNAVDRFQSKTEVLYYDENTTRQLTSIVGTLKNTARQTYSNINDITFRVRILNTPEVNAAAMPGGFIYINTGLLDFAESRDEVAFVLAHEMTHVAEDHYLKYLRFVDHRTKLLSLLTGAVGMAGSVYGIKQAHDLQVSYSDYWKQLRRGEEVVGVTAGARLATTTAGFFMLGISMEGYSQSSELDADRIAMELCKKAGFNPRAGILLMKKWAYLEARQATLKLRGSKHTLHLIDAKPGIVQRIAAMEGTLDGGKAVK